MSTINMTDPVSFNGTDLNLIAGWRTTGTDTFRYPTRKLTNSSLAHTDKTITTSAYFTGRSIDVRGVITISGRELLDDSISELKRILQPINKTLQLPISGTQRVFSSVTVKNIIIQDVAGGFAKIDVEFATSDPHSYDLATTELLNALNLASGDKSYPVTFVGTAQQLPVITLTIDSMGVSINRTVTFYSPAIGTSISIQRDWTATEVLVIDNLNQTVKVDGTDVGFTGNFLAWDSGMKFINYTDNFGTRQVDINVTYTKRYL